MVCFFEGRGRPQPHKSPYSVSYSIFEHGRPMGAVAGVEVVFWKKPGPLGVMNTLKEDLVLGEKLTTDGGFGQRPVPVVLEMGWFGEKCPNAATEHG